jgi:hypothetical protein
LIPEQKQSELQRHRDILLATLDYLEERVGGSIVFDQYDPATEYYQQQKLQTEKYYKQRRLDRLQQLLASLAKGMQSRIDLEFAPYIKKKTGYDIYLFEDLRKCIETIVAQNEICSQNELNDVGTMLHFYHVTAADGKEVEKLNSLLAAYSKRTNKASRKRNGEYSEVISRVEKDGIEEVTVKISSGPKPKHLKEHEATSPDGKRKLRVVQWSDGKHASTYVDIMFPTASGAVYGMSGIHDVRAFWKDNSTIVIETPKDHTANTQHKQVRSFDDVISIEYVKR